MKRVIFILRESFSSSVASLVSNKLRTFLTLLGIVIGVMTIIAILSVINGLNKTMKDTFASLGTKVLYVERRSWGPQRAGVGVRMPGRRRSHSQWWRFPRMRDKELSALTRLNLAEYIVPMNDRWTTLSYLDGSSSSKVIGTNTTILNVRPLQIETGRFFSSVEDNQARFVAVLGHNVYSDLFTNTGEDGIGKSVKIGTMSYTVLGKLKKAGQMSMGFDPNSDDNVIFIPISTFFRQFGKAGGFDQILVSAYEEKDLDLLEEETRNILRRVRNRTPMDSDNFGINRQDYLLDQYNESTKKLWYFIIGIAALSLLVGGIGVMNIMLISVTERTREIGLRKALGAKRIYILLQFLLEALIVCWVGGTVGVILGIGITWSISLFTPVPLPCLIILFSWVFCLLHQSGFSSASILLSKPLPRILL